MLRSLRLPISNAPVAFEVIDQRGTVEAPGLLYSVCSHVTPEEVERLRGDTQGAAIGEQAGPPRSGQIFGQSPHSGLDLVTVHHMVCQQSSLGGVGWKNAAHEQCLASESLADEAGQAHGSTAREIGRAHV